jgi:hypothetical protein
MSCSTNFIDIAPLSTVTVDNLYKTDKDYQDAVIGMYSPLRIQYENFWQFGDLPGDDTEQQHSASLDLVSINNFFVNSSMGLLNSTWLNYYKIIYNGNTLLTKIEDADASVITNKDRHIGEAKFLRALSYFDLVRIFGDVPMVTTPITIEEASIKGRDKVEKIYDEVIIKDLLDAEKLLPERYTGVNVGRATKGAAKALLGKVYLTRKNFPMAEEKLREVTTMSYSLLKDYRDLFDFTKNEHHSEYIFDIEYTGGGLGLGSTFSNKFVPNMAQIISFFGLKGAGGQQGSPTQEIFTLFEANDVRKSISISKVTDGLVDKDGKVIPMVPIDLTTYSRKYVTPLQIQNDSPANWKVIRYGDVLLMFAETLNENGKTNEALNYLNLVRNRAGLGSFSNLTKDDTREKIYLERRFELHLEGHRWFDLIRTGRALSKLKPLGMQPYMTVFPIPLSQIQIINNPTIFPQNPGYD